MTKRVRSLIGGLAVLACATSSAQSVYQCAGPGGQKVFQNAPCTDGRRLDVKPTPNMGGTVLGSVEQSRAQVAAAKRDEQAAHARAMRDQEVRIAIQQRRAVMGMTESELMAALGQPGSINVTALADGRVRKQFVYPTRDGRDNLVYTDDGIVSAMQWSEKPQRQPSLKVH